ncbi:hypothetical protein B0H15DRAFT_262456 [Mycena belliarum]|uniref:Lipoyl-binding domain-containing protein n=1 Tax=Mycena belliarum TaxID=1033014 RepID=A0AAD6U6D2_9AGAR|nr:hypothetical protein B0H15DRAFT_262456 [Mycena belliae]
MPAVSPYMTEGIIRRWVKKEGQTFFAGDVLLEIESDYAVINVQAQKPGVMGKILWPDGSPNVPVEQVIALAARSQDELMQLKAQTQMERLPTPPSFDTGLPQYQPHFNVEPSHGGAASLSHFDGSVPMRSSGMHIRLLTDRL